MRYLSKVVLNVLAVCTIALLSACGSSSGSSGTPPGTGYSVGVTVTGYTGTGLVLQNNGGDNLPVSANGSYTFPTALSSGAHYSVTVSTQPGSPSQGCAVTNSNGVIAAADVTNVMVTCRNIARFAYALNSNLISTIAEFSIESSTGVMTNIGSVVTPSNSGPMVVDAKGRFIYLADSTGNHVNAYIIDQGTGLLTAGPILTGIHPWTLTTDSTGQYVYVVTSTGSFNTYQINSVSGALMLVGSSAINLGFGSPLVLNPTANFLYGFAFQSGLISYEVNNSNGQLTQTDTPAGSAGVALVVHPNGNFAYSANADQTISIFGLNSISGAVVVAGVATTTGTPGAMVTDPAGNYLYLVNPDVNTISAYSINPTTGALTNLGVYFQTGNYPSAITIDPSGKYLYAVNTNDGTVSGFSINSSTGMLTSVGAPVSGVNNTVGQTYPPATIVTVN